MRCGAMRCIVGVVACRVLLAVVLLPILKTCLNAKSPSLNPSMSSIHTT